MLHHVQSPLNMRAQQVMHQTCGACEFRRTINESRHLHAQSAHVPLWRTVYMSSPSDLSPSSEQDGEGCKEKEAVLRMTARCSSMTNNMWRLPSRSRMQRERQAACPAPLGS